MLDTVNGLARADAVGVIRIRDIVERLELPSLFPRERMPKVCGRVALRVVGDRVG